MNNASNAEASLRQLMANRTSAIAAAAIEPLMADMADDVVTFEVVNDLRTSGKALARANAEQWLASYHTGPSWEDRDIRLFVGDTVAFAYSLSRVTGQLTNGSTVDMWFRSTFGFERRGNRWWIVHIHASDPFDPTTGQAAVGLKP